MGESISNISLNETILSERCSSQRPRTDAQLEEGSVQRQALIEQSLLISSVSPPHVRGKYHQ